MFAHRSDVKMAQLRGNHEMDCEIYLSATLLLLPLALSQLTFNQAIVLFLYFSAACLAQTIRNHLLPNYLSAMAERRQHPRAPGTTHSVRRNLFNSQLSRRPPTTATSSSSTGAGSVAHFDSVLDAATDDSSSDILVRNANGEYAVTIPGVPPPAADAAAVTGAGAGGEEEAADLEVESMIP